MNETYDVIIIGGGIMGCSTAFYLMKFDDQLKVAVVEKDPTYSQASTTLSLGNVRIQFDIKENIQISQYAFEVFDRFEEEMAVDEDQISITRQRYGNLHILDDHERVRAEEALALQKSLGCNVDWWSTKMMREVFPLYSMDGFVGGTFGPEDGRMDPYGVLMAYKTKARSLGAIFIKDEVVQIKTEGRKVTGVRLRSDGKLAGKFLVNCAGAWAAKVAETAGVKIPVIPVKRQVFVFEPKVKPEDSFPDTVLPSGLYIVSETGNQIIVGKAMEKDPIGFDFSWDEKRFTEIIWPELAHFIPVWDTLRLLRGWAGLYAVNTLDENAILGEWPELGGFFLANGFSGHGFQQGPAVGRYLSELVTGRVPKLDLSIFGPERILENKRLQEKRPL